LFVALALCQACDLNIILSPTQIGPGETRAEPAPGFLVDRVELTPAFVEVPNGTRFQISAQAFLGSVPVAGVPVLFFSTDPSIAQIVVVEGSVVTVKAEGVGTAEIVARVAAAEARARVEVRAASP